MKLQHFKDSFRLIATFSAVLTIGVLFFWLSKAEAVLDEPLTLEQQYSNEDNEELKELDQVISETGEAPINTFVPDALTDTVAAQEASQTSEEVEEGLTTEPTTTTPSPTPDLVEPTDIAAITTLSPTQDDELPINVMDANEALITLGGTLFFFFVASGIIYAYIKSKK